MTSYDKDDAPAVEIKGLKAQTGKLPDNFAGTAARHSHAPERLDKVAVAIEDYRKEMDGIDADEFMKEITDDLWPERS